MCLNAVFMRWLNVVEAQSQYKVHHRDFVSSLHISLTLCEACESKFQNLAMSYSFIPVCTGHCVDLETAIHCCEKEAPETLLLTKRNI